MNKPWVATSGYPTVRLWDLASGKEIADFTPPATGAPPRSPAVTVLTASADGRFVAFLAGGKIYLWTMEKGKQPRVLGSPKDSGKPLQMIAVAFALEGSTLYGVTEKGDMAVYSHEQDGEMKSLGLQLTGRPLKFSQTSLCALAVDKHVVDADRDGVIRLLDIGMRREVQRLNYTPITALSVSRDGRFLVAASSKSEKLRYPVAIWSLPEGRTTASLSLQRLCNAIAVDANGTRIATASRSILTDEVIELWDVSTGKLLHTLKATGIEARALSFLPDGKHLIAVGRSGVISLWDTQNGKRINSDGGHTAEITALCYSSDGTQVLSASRDGAVVQWDVRTGREVRRLEGHDSGVTALVLARDGKTAYSAGYDGTIRIWDMNMGTQRHQLTDDKAIPASAKQLPLYALALSPDAKRIAAGNLNGSIRLWDLETKQPLRLLEGPRQPLIALAFAPDGRRLFSRDLQGGIGIWDPDKETPLRRIEQGETIAAGLLVSPDQKTLVFPFEAATDTVDEKWYLGLWDLEKGELTARHDLGKHRITAMAYGRDGKTILMGDVDGQILTWDLEKRILRPKYAGHRAAVTAIAIAPDGKSFASGSADTTVIVWGLSIDP
jgi:WD40 repeat protein